MYADRDEAAGPAQTIVHLRRQLRKHEAEAARLRRRIQARERPLQDEAATPQAPQADGSAGGALHLLGALPDAAWLTDSDDVILYVNPAAAALLGYPSPEALIGQSAWDHVHPEDRPAAIERGQAVRAGTGAPPAVQRLLARSGRVVSVEVASVRTTFRGRPAVLSSLRDVRGRVHLEGALSRSRELFYGFFRRMPVALCVTTLSDGTILDVNERYEALMGYSRRELIGATTLELGLWQCPDERNEIAERLEREGHASGEYTVQPKHGEPRQVLVAVQAVAVHGERYLLSSALEVTEQRQALRELQESEARLRLFAENVDSIFWVADPEDGRFQFVNAAYEAIWGRSLQALYADPEGFKQAILPEDRARVEREVGERRHTGWDVEYRIRNGEGELRWVRDRGFPIRDADGALIQLGGVVMDATDRKRAEAELVRARDQAEDLARMKGAFLGTITHEVRTPLTAILGFTSMLRQNVRPELRRFVSAIERSGRRLLLMLDSVLDLVELEAGTSDALMGTCDLRIALREVAREYEAQARDKGLAIALREPLPAAEVRLAPDVARRLLRNLIDNAIKFTDAGTITLGLETDAAGVRAMVEDTGIGIAQGFMPQLFEAFSQESTGLERTHQGSGLGLAVSKRLVDRLGGRIEVDSRKNKGSRFTVVLPNPSSWAA